MTPSQTLPDQFQRLTPDDLALYGEPPMLELAPPATDDPVAAEKRRRWIEWRAAPYPAARHSEYLYRPDLDARGGPKILVSAVMPTPDDVDAYLAEFPAKRRYDILGKKAIKAGYTAAPIHPAEHSRAIYDIVHSSDTRQGRAIATVYDQRPPDHAFPDYLPVIDPNYRDICTGVFAPDGTLAAYLLGKRVGHHVCYDEILGHAVHLPHDVMYLLHIAFLRQCAAEPVPPKCLNYGPWYSGKDPYSPEGGLNRWKRKTRFRPAYLTLASS